ncbi:hypothetical protein C8Q74DRAFT_1370515 [Fomes fomentarius]|nr:hypothetical protein C8Q74DRAFT_1370515 [Fomes fomentarius]
MQTIDVRLDDTDADITYHGKWAKTKSSLNFVHSDTLTSTTTSGSSFSCTFFGIPPPKLSTFNFQSLTFEIDGHVARYQRAVAAQLEHDVVLWSTALTQGMHTLVVTNFGHSFMLDYIRIQYNVSASSIPPDTTPTALPSTVPPKGSNSNIESILTSSPSSSEVAVVTSSSATSAAPARTPTSLTSTISSSSNSAISTLAVPESDSNHYTTTISTSRTSSVPHSSSKVAPGSGEGATEVSLKMIPGGMAILGTDHEEFPSPLAPESSDTSTAEADAVSQTSEIPPPSYHS